ncbi:MAG: hypothetical protein AAGA96_11300 [Verrucomicrobiota bacterium]
MAAPKKDPSPIERLLIISYHSGIDASAASHHIDDRFPELVRQGVDFEIISSVCGTPHEDYKQYRVFSGLPTGWRFEVRSLIRRSQSPFSRFFFRVLTLLIGPFYWLERLLVPLDATWSWFLFAAPVGLFRAIRFKPDVIYITSGSDSGQTTGLIVSKLSGIPFISEFQDPIVYQRNPNKRLEKYYKTTLERKLAEYSGRLVYLNENAKKAAQQRIPQYANKMEFIYPGLIAPPKAEISETYTAGRKIIAHFGTLSGNRNLESVLQALDSLEVAEEIEFHLYGHVASDILASIEKSPHKRLFKYYGKIPRQEALKKMAESDVLLLVQNRNKASTETIPSKAFEYMQTGKPVLGCIHNNKELEALLHSHGHLAADIRHPDDISGLLEKLISSDRTSLTQAVKPYTYDLAQCVTLLLELLAVVATERRNTIDDKKTVKT